MPPRLQFYSLPILLALSLLLWGCNQSPDGNVTLTRFQFKNPGLMRDMDLYENRFYFKEIQENKWGTTVDYNFEAHEWGNSGFHGEIAVRNDTLNFNVSTYEKEIKYHEGHFCMGYFELRFRIHYKEHKSYVKNLYYNGKLAYGNLDSIAAARVRQEKSGEPVTPPPVDVEKAGRYLGLSLDPHAFCSYSPFEKIDSIGKTFFLRYRFYMWDYQEEALMESIGPRIHPAPSGSPYGRWVKSGDEYHFEVNDSVRYSGYFIAAEVDTNGDNFTLLETKWK